MSWDSNLLPDQREAVCKAGCHVCVLAGPGTGKTEILRRRILYLLQEQIMARNEILALTFTRAAAHELRSRVKEELESEEMLPRISTLHSFALSQLLKNAPIIKIVPSPLRIADDWEERYIIQEDIKHILDADITIKTIQDKFNQLSSDWQTLQAEAEKWELNYRDPKFLAVWQQHRATYGYMLRSELVLQLKRSLEQNPDFRLDQSYKQILVDEYQDLNQCDLAVIKALTSKSKGAEVFVTGDDDQSIYGFRFAHPQGIRMFEDDYQPSSVLPLRKCLRCDKNILDLGLFVANLDPKHIPKALVPDSAASDGEVRILWFQNQHQEAECVAKICKYLTDVARYEPKDIMILIRSDHNGCFSTVLLEALTKENIPVVSKADVPNPLDEKDGREFLAILHLCVNSDDHLAWRTILQIRPNGIGTETIADIYEFATERGITFADALWEIKDSPEILPKRGPILCQEFAAISDLISQFDAEVSGTQELAELLSKIAEKVVQNKELRCEILSHVQTIMESSEAKTLGDLISSISISLGDKEQEIDPSSVNILTMHKAKGLTAKAVFIIGAEDEHIPGKNIGATAAGDERRLLYVSLTRARHALFITYCTARTGQQRLTGRTPGQTARTLSRFLIDAPIKPESGTALCQSLHTLKIT